MTNATPGPWRVARADEAPEHGLIIVDKEGGSIGDFMPPGPWMSMEEARANCRLAAAAHDMLAALELAQTWLANSIPAATIPDGPMPLPIIAAAIAKAKS
jgi:hypothetical protein